MPYINFSEDDLYRANTTDLVSYLERRGERVKRVGSTYQYIYTDGSGTHDSVTIHGGKWYDHKNQRGGYAVKFLQEFLGFSFQDSVIELLGGHCSAQTARPVSHEPPAPVVKPFELPKPNSDMRRVFAYLTKQRFIDPQIISHFAHEHKIYEDSKYHNAVFVGMDENGVPKQASVRSTLSFGKTFRITVASSDTNYSFSHFGNDEKLFVFEAPIDIPNIRMMNYYITLIARNSGNYVPVATIKYNLKEIEEIIYSVSKTLFGDIKVTINNQNSYRPPMTFAAGIGCIPLKRESSVFTYDIPENTAATKIETITIPKFRPQKNCYVRLMCNESGYQMIADGNMKLT